MDVRYVWDPKKAQGTVEALPRPESGHDPELGGVLARSPDDVIVYGTEGVPAAPYLAREALTIAGAVMDDRNKLAVRRRIGYVVQDGGLFPHLTAERNVTLVARYLGWEDAFDVEFADGLCFLEPHASIRKANHIAANPTSETMKNLFVGIDHE